MANLVSASCDKVFLSLWLRGWNNTDDLTAALINYWFFLKSPEPVASNSLRWHAWQEGK